MSVISARAVRSQILAVARTVSKPRAISRPHSRPLYTTPVRSSPSQPIDLAALLSKPTWSVASLLPPKSGPNNPSTPKITSEQLHHLLRLSALPPPSSPAEEGSMLSTLSSQLHFVQQIQKVDTSSVEPLCGLRDETAQGEKESEIGVETLRKALDAEEVRGKFHKRIRRRSQGGKEAVREMDEEEKKWDVLGTAERKVGRFFVVDGVLDR